MADGQKKVFEVLVSFTMPVLAESREEAYRVARQNAEAELRNGCAEVDATEILDLESCPKDLLGCLCWGDPEEKTVSQHLSRGTS